MNGQDYVAHPHFITCFLVSHIKHIVPFVINVKNQFHEANQRFRKPLSIFAVHIDCDTLRILRIFPNSCFAPVINSNLLRVLQMIQPWTKTLSGFIFQRSAFFFSTSLKIIWWSLHLPHCGFIRQTIQHKHPCTCINRVYGDANSARPRRCQFSRNAHGPMERTR